MERVKVTFYLEVSDPEDHTGVKQDHFETIHDTIAQELGGDEIKVEKVNE